MPHRTKTTVIELSFSELNSVAGGYDEGFGGDNTTYLPSLPEEIVKPLPLNLINQGKFPFWTGDQPGNYPETPGFIQ